MITGIAWADNSSGKVAIAWGTLLSGHESLARNALVNLLTIEGSDKTFPERGTDLVKSMATGALPTQFLLQHALSFAAVDTLQFTRENDYVVNAGSTLSNITVRSAKFLSPSSGLLQLKAGFVDGVTETLAV